MRSGLLLVALGVLFAGSSGADQPDAGTFQNSVRPFFAKTCYGCHNNALQSGGLNLQSFIGAGSVAADRDHFEAVVEKPKPTSSWWSAGFPLNSPVWTGRRSPIRGASRGKWILENILNAPPPPPPADVPSLDEGAVGVTASLREQLEKHRANAVCASCHSRMDPLGFALENYDAIGQWRDKDGKFPIDATGQLPDGRKFVGAKGLADILMADPNGFAKAVTEKMLTYALGRGLEAGDRPAVNRIVTGLAADRYRFSSLVLGIVNSVPFLDRRAAVRNLTADAGDKSKGDRTGNVPDQKAP